MEYEPLTLLGMFVLKGVASESSHNIVLDVRLVISGHG